jgi:hypothetical protein
MRIDKGLAVLAGALALSLAAAAPASAEMFTCHDKPGQVLYSYNGSPDSYRSHSPNRRSYGYGRASGSQAYGSATQTRYYRAGSSQRASYFDRQRSWNDR